ncbi:Nibrin [Operophtera brumata]|uniref:Nibrin n=1 Tax=Operophtera brumata TaxID=104452 RepID=A0A0L7LHJ5_OPEBR|nr:Nibrin [Operophtera brumata]
MWFITADNDQRVLYIIPHKSELTIGRSPDPQICDFAIQDDPSISRKHATLVALDEGLFLTDLGSRYGTSVNNSAKLEVNNKVKLASTDVIKFGKMTSVWKVNEVSFVTCTSTLKGENLQTVKQNLSKIGGILKNDWEDSCKYLTMPAITLTIKVVLALVQGSYIVTTQFWNKCVEAINNKEALPDPKKYTPEILESTLNKDIVSFLPNKNRSNLFAGKKFIFFSKRQFDMYKNVLAKSSATPLLLSESQFTKSMLSNEEVVMIQYNITSTSQETEAQKNQITEIITYLKTKGKRVVADAEIGLAILYCSTTKYCNPAFNFPSEVVKQAPVQSSNKILAQETQDEAGGKCNKAHVVINESLTNDDNKSKRKLSEISDDEPTSSANKKVAGDVMKDNRSAKRKHADEDDDGEDGSLNPCKKVVVGQEEDFFNFITPASKNDTNDTANKLNLAMPQKRKADFDADEDLFNFVQGENSENTPKRSMFEENKTVETKTIKTETNISAQDIVAMRGAKLEELEKDNLNFINANNIKKEFDDQLNEKMNLLDIGSIVVTIKKELIVKKEPLEIEEQDVGVKNFKKFKKVWPLKMQVTIIPKSSMHSITAEGFQDSVMANNVA